VSLRFVLFRGRGDHQLIRPKPTSRNHRFGLCVLRDRAERDRRDENLRLTVAAIESGRATRLAAADARPALLRMSSTAPDAGSRGYRSAAHFGLARHASEGKTPPQAGFRGDPD
jgi:hypothetical protein